MTQTLYIGIDPGVNTGLAVWDKTNQKLLSITTTTITTAFELVRSEKLRLCFSKVAAEARGEKFQIELLVFMEDARQRNWFGQSGREKLQGAGSVKRDCAIWETFCKEAGIELRKIAPKNNYTKLSAEQFRKLTGWKGRTSDHGRDAAMLVFGR